MTRFRVFLGAPSPSDTDDSSDGRVWQTLENPLLAYPTATLDAASRRISFLYQNVIFDSVSEHHTDPDVDTHLNDPDGTTFVTWPPTPAPNIAGVSSSSSSFFRPSGSLPRTTYETQETGSSIAYSDSSSVARFPNFQFSLHSVTPLSSLYAAATSGRGSRKLNVLLVAIEVQGPDTVHTKKGPDAGQDVSILKLILGDDQGSVCKLTAWREVADAWGGGFGTFPGIKRGDVLYFENLVATWETGNTVTLTASPYNKPSTQICYRTMPYTHQDNILRPDLRLGQSDALVSKVAALVRWFENMAGLPGV